MGNWTKIVGDFAKPIDTSEIIRQTTHKRCLGCERLVDLNEFYLRPGHGYASRCKPCYIKQQHDRQKASAKKRIR
jgi:hypothetical protein